MRDNPYSPPTADVEDVRPAGPLRPRPRQILLATALLWVSLLAGIPNFYFTASRGEYGFHPVVLGLAFIVVAFEGILNTFIYLGHNWARIVTLVLALISLPMYLFPPDKPIPPSSIEHGINMVVLLLHAAGLYLVFTKPGAPWFKPNR